MGQRIIDLDDPEEKGFIDLDEETQAPNPQARQPAAPTAGLPPRPEEMGILEGIPASIGEQFQMGKEAFMQPAPGEEAGLLKRAGVFGTRLLGELGMVTSPGAPLFRLLENIARTGVRPIVAGSPGMRDDTQSQQQASANVSNILNLSERQQRPTTGNPQIDFAADIISGFVPIEVALLTAVRANRFFRLGNRAAGLRQIAEEAGTEAAIQVKNKLRPAATAEQKMFPQAPERLFTREVPETIPTGAPPFKGTTQAQVRQFMQTKEAFPLVPERIFGPGARDFLEEGKEMVSRGTRMADAGSERLARKAVDEADEWLQLAKAQKADPETAAAAQRIRQQSEAPTPGHTPPVIDPSDAVRPEQLQVLRTMAGKLGADDEMLVEMSTQLLGKAVPETQKDFRILVKILRRREKLAPGERLAFNPSDMPSERGAVKRLFRGEFEAGFLDLRSSLSVLKKQGPAGTELAAMIRRTEDGAEIAAGKLIDSYEQIVKGLSGEDKQLIRRFLDLGEEVPPRLTEKALGIRGVLDDTGRAAVDAGVMIRGESGELLPFALRENFFPHNLNIKRVLKQRKMIQAHLVKTGSAGNLDEAAEVLNNYIARQGVRRFGNLEYARKVDLPEGFYNTDLDSAIKTYLYRSSRRLEEIETFGQNDEAAWALISRTGTEGGDVRLATEVFQRFRGISRDTRGAEHVSRLVRAAQVPLLAFAQILNLSQSALTALRTTNRATAHALLRTMVNPKEARRWGVRSGAILDSTLGEIASDLGARGGFVKGFLKWTGFQATERINRIISANAGEIYARALGKKLLKKTKNQNVRKQLAELDIDPERVIRKGYIDEDDLLRAAQKVTNETQFRVRSTDLPLFWQTPFGRVITQYKTFALNQTKLMQRELVGQWVRNPRRAMDQWGKMLTTLPVASTLFVEGRQRIREKVAAEFGVKIDYEQTDSHKTFKKVVRAVSRKAGTRLEPYQEEILASMIEDTFAVGAFGLVADAWQSAQWGIKSALTFLGGPSSGMFASVVVGGFTGELDPVKREAQRRLLPFLSGPKPRISGRGGRRAGR
ncbi:hypothetical protein MYX75_02845 [Acidobacteria bacterium AH-259-A15]|nr:hypothetical protein [Acidobacteria bacterium AH-259-A15]